MKQKQNLLDWGQLLSNSWRSKCRNGHGAVLGSWKCPSASLLFSQRDLASLLSPPWQAQGRPETLGLRLLHKAEPGLALVKKELKENWRGGSPGPFWRGVTPESDSPSGLWLLNYRLMDGLSRPGTVLCKAGMRSPTQLTASSIGEEEKWDWTPEGAVAPAHSRKAPSPKGSRSQSNPRIRSAPLPHPTNSRWEAIQKWELHIFAQSELLRMIQQLFWRKRFTAMLNAPIDFKTCSDFRHIQKLKKGNVYLENKKMR